MHRFPARFCTMLLTRRGVLIKNGAMQSPEQRGQWSSRTGFILAAAGSAVGLGNIWRFPYLTGENGGAAFVVVYLACVFLIGVPLLYCELALGRSSGRNPVGAFRTTRPGTPFIITGIFCLLVCFFVLSYYGVIAGWTIGYAVASISQTHLEFKQFAANPLYTIGLFGMFIFLTVLIVQAGVQKGIERWSKVLMPLLFLMIVAVILRSVTLEGAAEGVVYYLSPDFTKIDGNVMLRALGQAFFSLSVGWGLMITYGSYMPKSQNMISNGFWVAFVDTTIALLAGFMIFPAVFAFGMQPDAGTSLTFATLPAVFEQMPYGLLIGAIFFLLLTIAALTSSISMLEVPISYLVDEKDARRKISAWIVGMGAFVIGIPSALSNGAVPWLTEMTFMGQRGFLAIMDYIFGTLLIVVITFLVSVYVGWVWGPKTAIQEIEKGSPHFTRPFIAGISQSTIWVFFIRFVCPIVILIVFGNMLWEIYKSLFGSA
jgi:neurotransmitter:Na+ symporter, NSS family